MSIFHDFTNNETYLHIIVTGVVSTPKEVLEYSSAFRGKALESGLRRLLLDYRDTEFNLDYADLLAIAEYADTAGLQMRGFRMAALPRTQDHDLHQQFETTALNRSIVYRSFLDVDEAIQWLHR